mgnify:CR=1 FL=1
MELYNFFSEVVKNKEKIQAIQEELQQVCHSVHLIKLKSNNEEQYSIIGQMYGEDTIHGDMDLLNIFGDVKYTWFDAYCPNINNL